MTFEPQACCLTSWELVPWATRVLQTERGRRQERNNRLGNEVYRMMHRAMVSSDEHRKSTSLCVALRCKLVDPAMFAVQHHHMKSYKLGLTWFLLTSSHEMISRGTEQPPTKDIATL